MKFYYVTINTKRWKTIDRIFDNREQATNYTNYLIRTYPDKYTIKLKRTGELGDVFEGEEFTIIESKGTYQKERRQ